MKRPAGPSGNLAHNVCMLTVAHEHRPVIENRSKTDAVFGSEPLARPSSSSYTCRVTVGLHTAIAAFSANARMDDSSIGIDIASE